MNNRTHCIFELAPIAVFAIWATTCALAQQSPSATPETKLSGAALSVQIKTVRQEVLNANGALMTSEVALLKRMDALKKPDNHISMEDRLALHKEWIAHENQVRSAAIKIDPTVAAYF